jgi:hypothetical protein
MELVQDYALLYKASRILHAMIVFIEKVTQEQFYVLNMILNHNNQLDLLVLLQIKYSTKLLTGALIVYLTQDLLMVPLDVVMIVEVTQSF